VYETLFLTDIMGEQVGTRLEGKDININLQYVWNEINNDGTSNDQTFSYIGQVAQARSYNNVSTGYQLGFEFLGAFYLPSSKIKAFDNMAIVKLKHNQLATITDRILYNLDVTYTLQFQKYGNSENKGMILECFNVVSYYIENNLALTLNVDYRFQQFDHGTNEFNYDFYAAQYKEYGMWNFGFGLNYRFMSM